MSERERNEILLNILLFLLVVGALFSCLGGVYLYNLNKDCPVINIETVELNPLTGDGAIYGNVEPRGGRTIVAVSKPKNTGPGVVTLETTQTKEKVGFTIYSDGNHWGTITIAFKDSEGCVVKESISCGAQKHIDLLSKGVIALVWVVCGFVIWRIVVIARRRLMREKST